MADALSRAERVARRRAKLRAAGLRPVQIWLPDTRAAEFAAECRRQSQAIRDSDRVLSSEDAFWEAVSAEALSRETG